jgi:prevent-host-death family protein
MPTSIAQSRQQLSALIAAAQQQPQVITNRNTPVAVLVSADYFARSEAAAKSPAESFYSQVLQLRATFAPHDDAGLAGQDPTTRQTGWQRANAFGVPD